MKKNILLIISLTLLILFTSSSFAQNIDPDLLKRAKVLGVSEQQIKQEIAKQNKTTLVPSGPTVDVSNQYTLRTSDTYNVTEQPPRQISPPTSSNIYGQNMFKNNRVTYEPNLNIPTPVDYVLSIGDEVIINVWGESELIVKEAISPEGLIYIPNLGPININGMTVPAAKKLIESKMSTTNQSIGSTSQIMLSVGKIRSIKVNITGEVVTPGTYTVPSLATLFHILHISGGTTNIGDLRNIEVFRNSKKVADMDIYNFIMNGNISGNIILKDGDVVVVPPYDIKASISGEIKRPMFYLMKQGESISSLIKFAGDFNEDAYKSRVKVFRKGGEYNEVITVEKSDFDDILINNGDRVVVERAKDEFDNRIIVEGAVWYPGDFQLNEQTNMLSKLIKYAGGLKGSAFSESAIIQRRNSDYTESIINFNPTDIVTGESDIELQNYDRIIIPTLTSLQEGFTITIGGEVNDPKTITYRKGMRIEDAIILAGGLKESATLSVIDVSRRVKDNKSIEYTDNRSELFSFEINEDLSLTSKSKEFTLNPYDIVVVRRSPQYKEQTSIRINGEVLMPGSYVIEQEETYLSDVLKMAKGATPEAYFKGASLIRQNVDANLNRTVSKLERSTLGSDSIAISSSDLITYPVAINFEKALASPHGKDDILLQEGDVITVPKFVNIVKSSGSVYYPNATTYSGKKLKKYIHSSGGYLRDARKRPFVVYQNGTVKATKNILFVKVYPKIKPGCLIVVPLKLQNRNKLSFAEMLSLASSTTSAAASIGTLGVSLSK